MKNILRTTVLTGLTLFTPLIASAQQGINVPLLKSYSDSIVNVINNVLVPVLMAIAFIVFLWGIYKYFIAGAANEGDKGDGRKFALWGVIGFVVILSLWGLVNLFMGVLGLSKGSAPDYPTIGGSTGTQTTSTGNGNTVAPTSGAVVGGSGVGAQCSGSGQSTCGTGLVCVTTGEGYNTCQNP